MTNTQKWITGLISTAVLVTGGIQVDGQIDPFIDKGAVYEIAVNPDDAGQVNKVEIAKDKPEVTLSRWNGEESIIVSRAGEFNAMTRDLFSKTGKLERKDGKEAVLIEPLQTDDGVKIDITLNEKPLTNKFDFNITGWEDLDFFYQPPLTQQEIDEGASRSDNVIGSYAVYHKTKKNHIIGQTNYETGKVFHIYRPKIIDNTGAEIWGELGYSSGTLTVTVDQNFLDSASYPVRIDPTLGYTSLGASADGSYIGCRATSDLSQQTGWGVSLAENGTLSSIHFGIDEIGTAGDSIADTFVAIYRRDDPSANNHTLVASVESLDFTFSQTKQFYSLNAASESLVADAYIISFLCNGEDMLVNEQNAIAFDVGDTGTQSEYSEGTTGAGSYATRKAENPWSEVVADNNRSPSLYITYQTTGGFNPYARNPKGPKGAGVSRDPNR